MRIVRYLSSGESAPRYGVEQPDGSVRQAVGDPFTGLREAGIGLRETGTGLRETGEPAEVAKLLAPIVPRAILCIGLNYADHAAEGGRKLPERPILFMKMPSAVQHPNDPIVLPRRLRSDQVDFEAELAVVIGRPCKNATPETALDFVAGYTCANDVSARDWQRGGGGGQWCRGKTFDTFAPMGPVLVTPDELGDPSTLRISTTVSGETMQEATTSDMIFSVPELITFLSASTTLEPGTVLLTGTPEGVGFARTPPRYLQAGEEVSVEIDRIGKLTNRVEEEESEALDRWAIGASEGNI